MKTESGPRSNRLNVWHCWWRLFGELLLGSQAKFCTPTVHMESILGWWLKQAPIQSTSCCKRMHEVQWNILKRCQSMPTRISWKSRCPNWPPRLWHWRRGLLCWRFLSKRLEINFGFASLKLILRSCDAALPPDLDVSSSNSNFLHACIATKRPDVALLLPATSSHPQVATLPCDWHQWDPLRAWHHPCS